MKLSQTFIVFRSRKTGRFVNSFKNNEGSLAYSVGYTKELYQGLSVPIKNYEEQKDQFKLMAKMLGCETVKVEANFELTHPNGSEVLPIEKSSECFDDFFQDFLKEVLLNEHN